MFILEPLASAATQERAKNMKSFHCLAVFCVSLLQLVAVDCYLCGNCSCDINTLLCERVATPEASECDECQPSYMQLTDNELNSMWIPDSFKSKLLVISVGSNPITDWTSFDLDELPALESMIFENIDFHTSASVLQYSKPNPTVHSLWVINCQLTSLDMFPDFYEACPNIIILNLDGNRLEELPSLRFYKSLQFVSLLRNNIKAVNPETFPFLYAAANLHGLLLGDNPLESLNVSVVREEQIYLGLRNTLVRDFDFQALSDHLETQVRERKLRVLISGTTFTCSCSQAFSLLHISDSGTAQLEYSTSLTMNRLISAVLGKSRGPHNFDIYRYGLNCDDSSVTFKRWLDKCSGTAASPSPLKSGNRGYGEEIKEVEEKDNVRVAVIAALITVLALTVASLVVIVVVVVYQQVASAKRTESPQLGDVGEPVA